MPYLVSDKDNTSIYISLDSMSIGGILSTINIEDSDNGGSGDDTKVSLPFDGYILDIVVRHITFLSQNLNTNNDTNNNNTNITSNTNITTEVTINELKTLSFPTLFTILKCSDFLCIDTLLTMVMKIIATTTLELTPEECAEKLLNKSYDALEKDEQDLLIKICMG